MFWRAQKNIATKNTPSQHKWNAKSANHEKKTMIHAHLQRAVSILSE